MTAATHDPAVETVETEPGSIHAWPDLLTTHGDTRALPIAPRASTARFHPWWDRHDLWHSDQLFVRSASWKPFGRDEWLPIEDALGRVAPRRVRVPEPIPLPAERPDRPRTNLRRVIALLAGWHQATTRQIAAWCGINRRDLTNRVLRPLWQAGIISRGSFGAAFGRTDHIWQLELGDPLFRWLDDLDHNDWVNVTLGKTPDRPNPNLRHNLLVTELTLRATETLPLTAVFGEPHTRSDNLFSNYQGPDLRGDACFVREDGLRIIIEMIHTQHEHGYTGKLAAWGRWLGATQGPHHSGTVICFVHAEHDIEQLGKHLRDLTEKTLTAEGLTDPKTGVPATAKQVAIARTQVLVAAWPDWYPTPHDLSAEAVNLTAGYLTPQGAWKTADLADPASYPFRPPDPDRFAMPAQVASQLWVTPRTLATARFT